MSIINFLDQHSGSFMLIITFIYVIATVGIFRANKKAANASRDQLAKTQQQLEESREQFEASQAQLEETRRLEHMPFLMIEMPYHAEHPMFELELHADSVYDTSSFRIVTIKNIGNGTAANMVYSWEINGNKEDDVFPLCSIMKGDCYYFQITVLHDEMNDEDRLRGALILQFDDLMGKTYKQRYYLTIESGVVVGIDVDFPEYCGTQYYSLKADNQNENGDKNA